MIIDCITYNGESDLFDLRYNILKDYVDEFIVVEFKETFSGKKKELLFTQNYPKVRYCYVPQSAYEKYQDLAESSPNTVGAEHWKREFMQKESIKDCLTHLQDDDIVFIGDCDEIWKPQEGLEQLDYSIGKLKLLVYTYWLNNRSSEEFWGIIVGRYKSIKNQCLNHLRSAEHEKMDFEVGWHFTSMAKSLKQKLQDSYTAEDYATDEILDTVDDNIQNDRDFLGRNFTYKIDESEWPQYLKDNKEKYKHLLKQP